MLKYFLLTFINLKKISVLVFAIHKTDFLGSSFGGNPQNKSKDFLSKYQLRTKKLILGGG